MKAWCDRVSAPGFHSAAQAHQYCEDIMVVGQLAVKLYNECQEAADIQEALKWDVALQGKMLRMRLLTHSHFYIYWKVMETAKPHSSVAHDVPPLILENFLMPVQSLTENSISLSHFL
jgi:hypothetical protein